MENYDIDFVILWVDGSDPEWINTYNKYCTPDKMIDSRQCQYREFGLLRYWFRGVEKFAPWVNKVYFVTCGQKPTWLNVECRRLVWVKHLDYIPWENLPLYNSQAIEVGLHRIQGLSDHFVYFNDDLYLTDYVQPDFFFKEGVPRDMLVMSPLVGGLNSQIAYAQLTDCALINSRFEKHKAVTRHFSKFFNICYGGENLRNLLMLPFPNISTFLNHHFAQPFLKKTFEEAWNAFPLQCAETQKSRFREPMNVNQWLFRYWQLMSGNFVPTNLNKGRRYYTLGKDFSQMCHAIKTQKYKEIVINDGGYDMTEQENQLLLDSFEAILPDKSEFEI